MKTNPIIDEIHNTRREYAERFGNDLHAICEDARRKQGRQGRRIVPASPKPAEQQDIDSHAA
jgi:hypothetical protein